MNSTTFDLLQLFAIVGLVFVKDWSFSKTLKSMFDNFRDLREDEKRKDYSIISLLRNDSNGREMKSPPPDTESPYIKKFDELLSIMNRGITEMELIKYQISELSDRIKVLEDE